MKKLIATFALLAFAAFGNAAIISLDDDTFQDTLSGNTYLKLDQTQTLDQVSLDQFLNNGWSIAGQNDADTLLTNFLFYDTNNNSGSTPATGSGIHHDYVTAMGGYSEAISIGGQNLLWNSLLAQFIYELDQSTLSYGYVSLPDRETYIDEHGNSRGIFSSAALFDSEFPGFEIEPNFSFLLIQDSVCSQNCDDPVSVPEPGTLSLLALGILGLGIARRKKL